MAKDPNILHGTRRVVIETVTSRHKKVCLDCARFPEDRRLLVVTGSGISQVQEVRCIACGAHWLNMRLPEIERAVIRLRTGEGAVRI